ncbi:MAG: hypothetical protein KIT18_02040 [Burkholderiales bacterium]|nr:hypothetical protein [Burkholderiales bacterium]
MRQDLWLYPIVEIFHISGFVVLVGSIVILDLRLLGLSRQLPVQQLARHVLPWTLGALVLIVPTGLLMFMAHATDFLTNPAFQLKLLLILLAGVNAAAFHMGALRAAASWDYGGMPPVLARLHAAFSLALWFGVIACGRLLAYV